jgi:hypothetical protein
MDDDGDDDDDTIRILVVVPQNDEVVLNDRPRPWLVVNVLCPKAATKTVPAVGACSSIIIPTRILAGNAKSQSKHMKRLMGRSSKGDILGYCYYNCMSLLPLKK